LAKSKAALWGHAVGNGRCPPPHLRRGINLSGWFAQGYDKRGYTREHFENWTTVEDIALITSMGIRKKRE
jgi:hypothetical protein